MTHFTAQPARLPGGWHWAGWQAALLPFFFSRNSEHISFLWIVLCNNIRLGNMFALFSKSNESGRHTHTHTFSPFSWFWKMWLLGILILTPGMGWLYCTFKLSNMLYKLFLLNCFNIARMSRVNLIVFLVVMKMKKKADSDYFLLFPPITHFFRGMHAVFPVASSPLPFFILQESRSVVVP